MPLEIRSAASQDELRELYRLRYQVFVEEWKYYPENPQQAIADEFDDLDTTNNFLAWHNRRIVGGVRVVVAEDTRTSIDDFFDFAPFLPRDSSRTAVVGMFFVLPEYRRRGGPAFPLLTAANDRAIRRKISYLIAAVAPEAERIAFRAGFRFLAPRFFHEAKQLWVAPMLNDLSVDLSQPNVLACGTLDGTQSFARASNRSTNRISQIARKPASDVPRRPGDRPGPLHDVKGART